MQFFFGALPVAGASVSEYQNSDIQNGNGLSFVPLTNSEKDRLTAAENAEHLRLTVRKYKSI